MTQSIHIKGTALDLSTPLVMGILNVTPDSFSDGGRYNSLDTAVVQANKMVNEGASILDVGGYSSRPGADEVSLLQELARVIPVVSKIARSSRAIISIDTFRSEVAEAAIDAGAHIVNDISAGEDDEKMIASVAKMGVPYIAMHKQGKPKNMQENPTYENVVQEVLDYLERKQNVCKQAGIKDFIIDPGFGFGKTAEHNYSILKNLHKFKSLNVPILAGVSRKSMIYKELSSEPSKALNGTTFLHAFALQGGASILRVHDVKEAVECLKLWQMMK